MLRGAAISSLVVRPAFLACSVLAVHVFHTRPLSTAANQCETQPWAAARSKTNVLLQTERYAEAESSASQAVRLAVDSCGLDNRDVAECLDTEAVCFKGLHRFAEAESVLKLSVALREKLGPADYAVLRDMKARGTLAAEQGKPAEAESLYWQVYTLARHVAGAAPDEAALAVEQMAMTHVARQDYPRAESLLLWAVQIYDTSCPNWHKAALLLDTLAGIYDRAGMPAKAESTRALSAENLNSTGRPW